MILAIPSGGNFTFVVRVNLKIVHVVVVEVIEILLESIQIQFVIGIALAFLANAVEFLANSLCNLFLNEGLQFLLRLR